MKLRIERNALRLRLTQREVAYFHDDKPVECVIRFPSGRALTYVLASSPDASELSVDYEGDSIRIVVPRALAIAWAGSSEITMEGPRDSGVDILIEKDFQCLHKSGDGDPDTYPNPFGGLRKRPAA